MHLWIRQSSLVHGRIGSIVGNANFETGVFALAAKGPPTRKQSSPTINATRTSSTTILQLCTSLR